MKVCLPCNHRFESKDWRCPRCAHAPATEGGALLFAPSLCKNNNGFRAEHFGELAEVEAKHFWFRNRNRLLIWALQAYFPAARNFLEVGCGTGFVLSGIRKGSPQLELAGGELFLEGLEFARSRLPGVPLYQMDAVHVPFEAEFDVVGAFDVLEHIEEDEAVLRQLHQALKPGGGLLVTVPQHPALWSEADVSACHKRRYTRPDLLRKTEAAGFRTINVTSFMSSLLPFLWASRRRRSASASVSRNGEFQINKTLNWLLEAFLSFENGFIRLGATFPLGGSLLLVAQKSSGSNALA
jgi:SAM-dependent methyltransferase